MKRLIALGLALAAPAQARLTDTAADGFTSVNEAVVPLPPARVWAALLAWSSWWDPAHSWSGKPGAISLDPRAGGSLAEAWPAGSVVHATVVNIMPPSLLRLSGGFGPLQALPVNAILDVTLKPQGDGTAVVMTYRVSGGSTARLAPLAAPVDQVMSAGFARLVRFATTGNPQPK